MMTFEEIEAVLDGVRPLGLTRPGLTQPGPTPSDLLQLGEIVLENWIIARGEVPTNEAREGFRLLALHRQGAKGDPSFNACRETCRELVYHYNLLTRGQTQGSDPDHTRRMMALVAKHLCLFVAGKMQVAGLGEFCCAAKPIRMAEA